MTEQELVDGIINQNRDAIGHLVNSYQKEIITTAWHFVKSSEDAEDIAQEVFMEVMRSAGKFRGRSSLGTWIYRITVNRSLDFLRKQKNRKRLLNLESVFRFRPGEKPETTEPGGDPVQQQEKETRELLEHAVNSLPENQRIAFILNKYDERSYKEIAEIMNLSLSSVESLIHRAKTGLQKKLVHHFSEYENKRR